MSESNKLNGKCSSTVSGEHVWRPVEYQKGFGYTAPIWAEKCLGCGLLDDTKAKEEEKKRAEAWEKLPDDEKWRLYG